MLCCSSLYFHDRVSGVGADLVPGNPLLGDGEFPVLKPGANAISWTGTVTKVVVRPNWRYL